jgi:hypothetical protein
MARHCTVCRHPQRSAIDSALAARTPYRVVARKFSARPDAVFRHGKRHLAAGLVQGLERKQRRSDEAILQEAKRIQADIRRVMGLSELAFRLKDARACIREERRLWVGEDEEARKTKKSRRQIEVPPELLPLLLMRTKDRPADALVFPIVEKGISKKCLGRAHWRDWPREATHRICRLVGVPEVCAHSLRGLHASLSVMAGVSAHIVAATLGHESVTTTIENYAGKQAVAHGQRAAVLRLIPGA